MRCIPPWASPFEQLQQFPLKSELGVGSSALQVPCLWCSGCLTRPSWLLTTFTWPDTSFMKASGGTFRTWVRSWGACSKAYSKTETHTHKRKLLYNNKVVLCSDWQITVRSSLFVPWTLNQIVSKHFQTFILFYIRI